MEFTPELAADRASSDPALRKRRFLRQKVQNLAYVNLEHENGGIIRDLGEGGLAVQTVSALQVEDRVPVRFELLAPRARVETSAKVIWTDSMGQAGMEFLELPTRSRRQLKDWIFTQLLASAYRASGLESVFVHHGGAHDATELLLSGEPRQGIAFEESVTGTEDSPQANVSLLGSSFAISSKTLARAVDSLIILCAVLSFVLLSSWITGTFPSWPVALALVLCVSTIFAGVYWALFTAAVGGTVGDDIARLASRPPKSNQDDRPRFR